MRTSLNEMQLLEAYLKNTLKPMEALTVDARLMIDKELSNNLMLQRQSYRLIRDYGRQTLREQLKAVEQTFIHKPQNKTLIQKIREYFEQR